MRPPHRRRMVRFATVEPTLLRPLKVGMRMYLLYTWYTIPLYLLCTCCIPAAYLCTCCTPAVYMLYTIPLYHPKPVKQTESATLTLLIMQS